MKYLIGNKSKIDILCEPSFVPNLSIPMCFREETIISLYDCWNVIDEAYIPTNFPLNEESVAQANPFLSLDERAKRVIPTLLLA